MTTLRATRKGKQQCASNVHERNERDEDSLFVCLFALLCPSSPSSATHGHSQREMGTTLEAHVRSRELAQTSPDP